MAKKTGGSQSVDAFLASHKHPLRDTALALVAAIRKAQPGLEEGIKWNAPSFRRHGDDRLTLNLSAKDRVRLILHCGAKKGPKRSGRLIGHESETLEWAGDDRAIMSFTSTEDVKAQGKDLKEIVKAWLKVSGPGG